MLFVSGCDMLDEQINKQKLIGKAIGAGCRQSGRSLEDCYGRNPRIAKPDIYSGWKEMSEYMQAKKLAIIPPPPDIPDNVAGSEHPSIENMPEAAMEQASAVAASATTASSAEKNNSKKSTKH